MHSCVFLGVVILKSYSSFPFFYSYAERGRLEREVGNALMGVSNYVSTSSDELIVSLQKSAVLDLPRELGHRL